MPDDRFPILDQCARELDREAELVAAPTSPETVRRVAAGRTRRRTVIVVVLLLAAVLAVAGAVIQSLQPRSASPQWGSSASPSPTTASASPTGSSTPSASISSTPASASDTSTPSAGVPSAGTVVTLATPLVLTSTADITAVAFLPDAAKAFLVRELARERTQWQCPTENLRIDAYRVGDLISGAAFGDTCGGDVILWGNLNGQWTALLERQSVPQCSEVRATGWTSTIPESFVGGVCYPSATTFTPVPYTP